MMNRKQAAQYFIVAWVKGWTLPTYLKVLADGGPRIPFDQAQALYPWLPGPWSFINHHDCRTHLAEANRPLSDALWDAADDRARLALAPKIEAFVFTGRRRGYTAAVQRELGLHRSRLQRYNVLNEASIESMRRGAGHHWQVCK